MRKKQLKIGGHTITGVEREMLVKCIDRRLTKHRSKLMEFLGIEYDNFYLMYLGGSSKEIAEAYRNDTEQLLEFFLRQFSIFRRSNGGIVYICHHSLCAAYGIADPEEEIRKQFQDFLDAYRFIIKNFPEFKVFLVWEELLDPEGVEVEIKKYTVQEVLDYLKNILN